MSKLESQQTPNRCLDSDQVLCIYDDHVSVAGAISLEIARLGLDGYALRAKKCLNIGLSDLIDNVAFATVPRDYANDQDAIRMAMPLQYGMLVGTQFARGALTYRRGFHNFQSRMSDEMSVLLTYLGSDDTALLNRLMVGGEGFMQNYTQGMSAELHLFETNDREDKPANRYYRGALGYVASIGFNMLIEHELRQINTDYIDHEKFRNDKRLMQLQMQQIRAIEPIAYADCDPALPESAQ